MNLFKNQKTYNELLPDFLADRKIALSDVTHCNYESKFNIIGQYLHNKNLDDVSLRKLDSNIISKFFVYLATERNLDRPTCEKYFFVFRSFFKFAFKRGHVDNVPFDLITLPSKKEDKGAKVIQNEDMKKILKPIRERDPQLYLACMMEYYCALRPGKEVRLMRVGDIDLESGVIRINADRDKVGRGKTPTMPEQLIELCVEYGIDKADKSKYVFGKNGGIGNTPWSENMLGYKFNLFKKEVGLPTNVKLYSFKCTGLTRLHESGIPIRESMAQAGHTSLAVHQHYLQKHGSVVNQRIRTQYPNPI